MPAKPKLPRGRWISGKIRVSRGGKVQVKVSGASVRKRKPATKRTKKRAKK